ncbi:MAG TPA: HEAT repeat domain-containing protein [Myxococcaceae bacterium]|nr:HEAT repeat domain-containing protein [Myxococcaceae bacterium]
MTTKKDNNLLKVATTLGAALLLGLGAAVLLPHLTGEASAGSESASDAQLAGAGTAASALQAGGGAAQAQGPKPVEEVLPMPGCWSGLLELDRHLAFDNFRQVLANAIAGRDSLLANYLQERLSELVGEDTGRALQVLEWAKQSAMPELGIYIEALKTTGAIHHPQVVEQLLRMGEDKGATLLHRGAAMNALDVQKRLTPATLARVKAIALDESLDSVSWLATRTIGRVMKHEYESSGKFSTYWKELLDISEKSDDLAVRLLALEMPSYFDPLLDKDSVERLSRVMVKDAERDMREMAAHRLAFTEDPSKSLEHYREAFTKEHDICIRWALLRFAFRAAGPEALPLAAQFAQQDPRLAQDYEDFKRLYADGTTDWSRIWPNKAEYHSCIVEDGAPH